MIKQLKSFFMKYIEKAIPPVPVKKRIGEVYFTGKAQKGFFFRKSKGVDISKSSKQAKKEEQWIGEEGLIPHPAYSFDSLYELFEHCELFSACINQLTEDTAGLGWRLVLKPEQEGKENKVELEKIESFLKRPNPRMTLRKIISDILQSRGIVGFAGIEAVRDAKGELIEIYPVRGDNLYIHKDRNKYCQKIEMKKVWFRDFGYEKHVHEETGEERDDIPFEKRANELIFFGTDYGKSTYYPIPKILPATSSVICLLEIKAYNLSFFSNYSVPAYAVTLEGEWDEDTMKYITQFLDTEVKGSNNQNKTLALQIPEGGKVTFQPLSVDVKEGSFKSYQTILEDDILLAHSMPPYRLGKAVVGKLGGTNVREATSIYKQSVVEPLQELLENIINYCLIEQGLDCHSYEFKFTDLDIRDVDAEVDRYMKLIEHACLTPNQARNFLDLGEPYPGGDVYYISKNLIPVGEEEVEKEDFIKILKKEFKEDLKEIIYSEE